MRCIKSYAGLLMSLCVLMLGLSACKAKDNNENGGGSTPQVALSIAEPEINVKAAATTKSVVVKGSVRDWTVKKKDDAAWYTVTRDANRVKLVFTENEGDKKRESAIVISGGGHTIEAKVQQLGADLEILPSQTFINLPVSGGVIDLVITTNVADFEVKLPEWIKLKELGEGRAARREEERSFVVEVNQGETARRANIELIELNPTEGREAVKTLIAVSQLGLSTYQAYGQSKLPQDVKIPIASGTDDSHQNEGSDIRKAFDGDFSTLYHSRWSRVPVSPAATYFPITLTLTLAEPSDVDYMIYHPRQDGPNGNFKEIDLAYTTDGTNWIELGRHDFKGSGAASRVVFNETLRGAKTFRIIVHSGAGDGIGYASAAEIEFYKKNPKSFDYKTLFKDEICSELKEDVTEQDILRCEDEFFRNLAYYMFKKRYDTEFRVAEYRAWPRPDLQGNAHKTNPYSLLDNPTGIVATAGEEMVVLVGDTHGFTQLAIRVVDLNKPGGDGFGQQTTYPLHRGVNRIKHQRSGLIYVMYHKDKVEVENEPSIKIHFAGGQVNGYYDNEKHKGRWEELLGKATYAYFDALGKYVHMTFPTEHYRSKVPTRGQELVERYDKVVNAEMLFLGLYKPGNMPKKNRMYMHVMYHSYMYATWYHTGYHIGTLNSIMDMDQYALWGPAHEIGHMNQTRPGVLWKGMTECTVNIKSAYIQTTIFNQPCRIQVENQDGNKPHNKYTKSWNSILVPQAPFANSDVFSQLVPFWQLELYFGKVLGNTPQLDGDKKDGFYPNLYEHYRNTANRNFATTGEFNGYYQTEFALTASKISGYDLTDFFTKWGYLREVDREIDDYGKQQLTVTATRIEEVKRQIKALPNLQSLGNIPLEYITDETVELFKNPKDIVKGSLSTNENSIILTGWENVVAFEVKEKDTDRLVFVGDGWGDADGGDKPVKLGKTSDGKSVHKLHLPLSTIDWSTGKYKVVAVSAKGDRVEATN